MPNQECFRIFIAEPHHQAFRTNHGGGFLIVLHQFQNHIFLIDDKISATLNRTVHPIHLYLQPLCPAEPPTGTPLLTAPLGRG